MKRRNPSFCVVLIIVLTIGLLLPSGALRLEASETTVISLQIGNPSMTVNGSPRAIDAGGTAPVIVAGRTLVPIRAVVEAIGGTVAWEAATKTVTIVAGTVTMSLTIGNHLATVDGTRVPIDPQNPYVVPMILGGRTMLPLRFVGEQLGAVVEWNASTQTATLTFSAPAPLSAPQLLEPAEGALLTSGTTTFRWTLVQGATSYAVSVSSGGNEVFHATSPTNTLSPATGVLATGAYSWTVRAIRGAEVGPTSLAARFTVKLPMSPADIVRAATPAIAVVDVEYASGGEGMACGFFTSAEGIFVTTYHVIKGAIGGKIILPDATEIASLQVLGYSPLTDVAILKVPGFTGSAFLTLATGTSIQLNQDVVMVGPAIAGVAQPTLAGTVNTTGKDAFTVRSAGEEAIEGAPVLDQFGQVAGMVTLPASVSAGLFPAVSAGAIGAVAQTGTWTLAQVTEREGTGLQLLAAPVPGEPLSEATVASLTPRFRWNAVAGATHYQLWLGEGRGASGNALWSQVLEDTTAQLAPGYLKPGTTYTWAVRAGNDAGWGPWSADRMFVTGSAIVQPLAPAQLEPLDGATVKAASPVLFWAAAATADRYFVRVETPSLQLVYEGSSVLPQIAVPAGVLSSGASYLWSVRCENASQVSSVWSQRLTFAYRVPTDVGVPSLLAPAPAAILPSLNPTFSWQAVDGATRYDLRIDRLTGEKAYEITVSTTTWSVPAGTLEAGQTYRWYVIAGTADAWSKTGDTWNWSITRKLTIAANAVATLVPPVLTAPRCGTAVSTPAVTLQWSTVTAASWYRVWVGKGTSFATSNPVYTTAINAPSLQASQSLALPAGILEAGVTYWWKVVAGTGTDTATSEPCSFTFAP